MIPSSLISLSVETTKTPQTGSNAAAEGIRSLRLKAVMTGAFASGA